VIATSSPPAAPVKTAISLGVRCEAKDRDRFGREMLEIGMNKEKEIFGYRNLVVGSEWSCVVGNRKLNFSAKYVMARA
jgi:hypothetical protein